MYCFTTLPSYPKTLQYIQHHNHFCSTVILAVKPFLLRLRRTMLQCIENIALEQLLVRHSDFDGHVRWAVFTVPDIS